MTKLSISYSDAYLNWKLGSGDGSHPTNPVRAQLAVQILEDELPASGIDFEIIAPTFEGDDREKLLEIHGAPYVSLVLDDYVCSEWIGPDPSNAATAGLMFGGTARLVEKIIAGQTLVGFNPQGAKHHAQDNYSSGFCVFNDMAWAALEFERAGMRPVYIDWDVHAGDGVQNILAGTNIPTYSIHGHGIFPNAGNTSKSGERGNYLYMDEDEGWYNYNLQQGSGDEEFAWAIDDIAKRIVEYGPNVILLATGADGHESEYWGMKYTYEGYSYAAKKISGLADKFLIGGAGGYQPFTHTPRIWANVVKDIAKAKS